MYILEYVHSIQYVLQYVYSISTEYSMYFLLHIYQILEYVYSIQHVSVRMLHVYYILQYAYSAQYVLYSMYFSMYTPYIQPIANREAQDLEITFKNLQFSSRHTRIFMRFIISTILSLWFVNPMRRILVHWHSFRENLKILCLPICNRLYFHARPAYTSISVCIIECSALQWFANYSGVLQCVAVCCSALQWVAVRCSAIHCNTLHSIATHRNNATHCILSVCIYYAYWRTWKYVHSILADLSRQASAAKYSWRPLFLRLSPASYVATSRRSVCICTCMYTDVYTCIHVCVCMVRACLDPSLPPRKWQHLVNICIYRYMYIHICIYTYIYIYLYMYIYIYMHLVNIDAYIYICIYINIL